MEEHIAPVPTELQQFQLFIARRLEDGGAPSTIAEAVEDYREYQRQLDDLKVKLQAAEASSRRGESAPLDLECLLERVHERLNNAGIPR